MHPRNVFAGANPDFANLAKSHPNLKPYLIKTRDERHTIDFKSWDATVELNRALLHEHYGILHWNVPRGHLCPPVANRANYVHWIEDLLLLSRPDGCDTRGPGVVGLDVGVGANCIYPLIGASLNGWRFVGCDVTDVAVACARANVAGNENVKKLVEIRDSRTFLRFENGAPAEESSNPSRVAQKNQVASEGSILIPAVRDSETFAFCMCNPPFFEHAREARLNQSTDFGGTAAERCFEGGEKAFTSRMLKDSVALKRRVHWFTTMCGKKETLKHLRLALANRDAGVTAVRTVTFHQGKTARWGIAWSFSKAAGKTNGTPLRRAEWTS
jgi:23S rRNA (adenine1618-N6)-methyltransferase